MKNLFKFSYVLLLVLLVSSCSQEENNVQNEELNSIISIKNEIEIDNDEVPILSTKQSRKIGFTKIDNDDTRTSFLNTEANILSVPFDKEKSLKSISKDPVLGLCIKITIARQNPNNSRSCSGGCIECIGFRCEFITFPCLIDKSYTQTNPQDREQVAEVIVNEEDGTVEYHFLNEIDWDYLANNLISETALSLFSDRT